MPCQWFVLSDSSSVNAKAIDVWNDELNALHHEERLSQSLFRLRCFSHMLSCAGTKLRESLHHLDVFMAGFKGMRKSESAKSVWTSLTASTLPSGSPNRWFS